MKKGGLSVTPAVFSALHKSILFLFQENCGMHPDTLADYQLYGYNLYDEELPSIKKLIFEKTGRWVNGKYLYNKYREWKGGASIITFSREFVFVYFQMLGFTDFDDFIKNSALSQRDLDEQDKLLHPAAPVVNEEYYVGYYIGEDRSIIQSRLTLSEENLKATLILTYWEKDDEYSEYFYEGAMKYQQNGMSLIFSNEGTVLDRTAVLSFFCERHIKIKPYLIGGYCGYDLNRHPVVGEIIFERVNSEEDQIALVSQKKVSSVIAQQLAGRRWIMSGKTIQNILDISPESKFAGMIDSMTGDYRGIYVSEEKSIFSVELSIQDNIGNTTLKIGGHPVFQGVFKVQASGQILLGQFVNTVTNTVLFISLEALPSYEKTHKGSILLASKLDQSLGGKLFISRNVNLKSIPAYKGTKLDAKEIKHLPSKILDDIRSMFNPEDLGNYLDQEAGDKDEHHLKFLAGAYDLVSIDAPIKIKGELQIHLDGSVKFQYEHFVYTGSAMMSEGSVLSAYFSSCNGIPHCGQIVGKIGRRSKEQLKEIEAKWLYLNDEYEPDVLKVRLLLKE